MSAHEPTELVCKVCIEAAKYGGYCPKHNVHYSKPISGNSLPSRPAAGEVELPANMGEWFDFKKELMTYPDYEQWVKTLRDHVDYDARTGEDTFGGRLTELVAYCLKVWYDRGSKS